MKLDHLTQSSRGLANSGLKKIFAMPTSAKHNIQRHAELILQELYSAHHLVHPPTIYMNCIVFNSHEEICMRRKDKINNGKGRLK
jgi:hypothetical protein